MTNFIQTLVSPGLLIDKDNRGTTVIKKLNNYQRITVMVTLIWHLVFIGHVWGSRKSTKNIHYGHDVVIFVPAL